LNILFEIALVACIICLTIYIFYQNKSKLNADSAIQNLNKKLQNKELELQNKETYFQENLNKLHSSFAVEQKFIEETKFELQSREKQLQKDFEDLQQKLEEETENRKKVLSQKKSSEVRLGSIAETLAPFLDQFEFNPEECTFLGKPIDYISFGDEEITFIEVKSGKSQLNAKQRHIRDQVKSKLVNWKEIRIK
jgi:predicted Holliday junction resolvase-like endonuclease